MKAALAGYTGDAEWRRVRPPLVELDDGRQRQLLAQLAEAGFEMPGLSG
ncbi:hypothetical protein [Billgrantia endophytica]|nr:hypothetical protein [Halomonas endophytica]